ncbi:MAG: SDR family oxidoreductase [Chloroflexi bacterium]|nr:SDR family oxidoreductase [Chloroflexota bacterium]
MRIDLSDKVALVTGSARRVGRAIALELARHGARILVHYHRAEATEVRETIQAVKSHGVDAHSVAADLSHPEGVDTVFSALNERYGRLDIVVNSASVFQKRGLLDLTLDDWDLTMAVNLRAPFLITQRAARLMSENPLPGGVIINICDAGADRPWKDYPHHGVSKSALWMLTQVSALTLAPAIRVNAIVPGAMLKPAGRAVTDEEWSRIGERNPLRRTGTPEDVARAVLYLCQEDFITGELLRVNAGEHLR